jgi:hypothetical protein
VLEQCRHLVYGICLYYTILYYIILYYIILHYIILYYIILNHTISYYVWLLESITWHRALHYSDRSSHCNRQYIPPPRRKQPSSVSYIFISIHTMYVCMYACMYIARILFHTICFTSHTSITFQLCICISHFIHCICIFMSMFFWL